MKAPKQRLTLISPSHSSSSPTREAIEPFVSDWSQMFYPNIFSCTNSHAEALKTRLCPYMLWEQRSSRRSKCLQHEEQSCFLTVWHTQISPSEHTSLELHLATGSNTAESHISDFPLGSSVLTAHQPGSCKSLKTHVMELPEGVAAGS